MGPYRSERIHADHRLEDFDSGEPLLDGWLLRSAQTEDERGTARTFVWPDDSDRVVAFFSLCPHDVRRLDLSKAAGHGSPDLIPAILLARLALHRAQQGQKLGTQLLVDAVGRAIDGVRAAGGRFIVVDALHDKAASFYTHYGFVPTPIPHRLVMKASSAAASFGLEWP